MEGAYVRAPYLAASFREFQEGNRFDIFIRAPFSSLSPPPQRHYDCPSELDLKQGQHISGT